MKTLNLKIVTSEKVVYEETVFQVSIPTDMGEITILPSHIPLVSVLKVGELKVKDASGEHLIAVAGGFVEVRGNDEVVVLANNAESAAAIDIERAEMAKLKAEEEMKKAVQDVDFAKLQAIIDRELNRIKVGKKYRNLPPSNS